MDDEHFEVIDDEHFDVISEKETTGERKGTAEAWTQQPPNNEITCANAEVPNLGDCPTR